MNPKSAIAKGKRFENFISGLIQESGLDSNAHRQIGSGSGRLKGDINTKIDFVIEAKNQATIHALDWVDQAKEQAQRGSVYKDKWAVVFRDPRTPETNPEIYAIIDFGVMLDLLKKAKEPLIKSEDRELGYKLSRAKNAIHDLMKYVQNES